MVGRTCMPAKALPGRKKITDKRIEELMREGQWNMQIMEKFKVGILRLRKIRRMVENG